MSQLSKLFADSEMALMAILPSALNGWVEDAVSDYGIPQLMQMVELSGKTSRAEEEAERREDKALAEARQHGMDADDLNISEENGIAVVRIEGTISPHYCYPVDPRGVAATMRALAANPAIATIVMDWDTPGGHVTYIREMSEAIIEARENTRVISYVGPGNMCASAGYWGAAATEEIYVSTAATIGSIGVFSALYEFSGMLDQLGVSLKMFRDGPLKGMGLFGKEMTAEEEAHVQAGVMKTSAEFKGHVRAARPGILDETMHGQVFDGNESQAVKLSDGVFADLPSLLAAEMARLS